MSDEIERFGKYILLEKIASGGMAEIFLARSSAADGLQKFLVIKKMLPHLTTNNDFVELFKQEAKVVLNLNHGAIVTIFDFGIEKNQYYLVMEYVAGKTLRQVLQTLKKIGDKFPISLAVNIVKEVSAGLDYAHRCVDPTTGKSFNIIHRDMDPQNIMISYDGVVKIIDFGIAKSDTHTSNTREGFVRGKVSYMSPEQAGGKAVDRRTDIFSLGVILWELLAQRKLFTGNNDLDIVRRVRKCEIPSLKDINPSIPPELERVVMKCLSRKPDSRYQTAADLHKDLSIIMNAYFPAFSNQELSDFMKNHFVNSYLKNRDNLVRYSEIKLDDLDHPSNPLFFNMPPPIPEELANLGDSDLEEQDLPEGITQEEVKEGKPKKANANFDHLMQPHRPVIDYRVNDDLKQLRRKVELLNHMQKPQKKTVIEKVDFDENKKINSGNIWLKRAVGFVFIAAIVFSITKFVKSRSFDALFEVRDIKKLVVAPPPAQDVKTAKQLELESATQQITEPAPEKIVRYAYVNINIEGNHPTAHILINGVEIPNKAPVFMHPIMPNEDVTISAYDAFNNVYGEKTIKLPSGEKIDLVLVLDQKK